jgi:hypothetical protein
MQVIKPIELNVSTLTIDSNITDPRYIDKFGTTYTPTAWSSGASFNIGDLCYYTNKKVYQSVYTSANTNHNPVTGNIDLATGLPYWVEVGSLNKYAAFDTTSNTQTVSSGATIQFKFTVGRSYSALALTNLYAESVTLSLVDPADESNVLWTETKEAETRTFNDWWEFAFNPFSSSKNMLFDSILPFSTAKTIIDITQTGGEVAKCGGIVLGELFDIGNLTYGASRPQLNYSAIVTDEFGNTTLTKRPSKGAIDGTLLCNAALANTILDLQEALNATPTVWVGLNEDIGYYYNSLFILGVYTQFEPTFDKMDMFRVKLYVKEL